MIVLYSQFFSHSLFFHCIISLFSFIFSSSSSSFSLLPILSHSFSFSRIRSPSLSFSGIPLRRSYCLELFFPLHSSYSLCLLLISSHFLIFFPFLFSYPSLYDMPHSLLFQLPTYNFTSLPPFQARTVEPSNELHISQRAKCSSDKKTKNTKMDQKKKKKNQTSSTFHKEPSVVLKKQQQQQQPKNTKRNEKKVD